MPSDRTRTLLVAAATVLAFGVLAASLDAGSLPGGDAGGSTGPEGPGGPPPANGTGPGGTLVDAPLCPAPMTDPATFGAVAAAVALGGVALYRWRGDLALPVTVCVPVLLGLTAFCPSVLAGVALPELPSTVDRSTLLLAGTAALALGAVAVFLSVTSGDEGALDGGDDGDDVDLSGIAAAAGDAADRIQSDADPSNAVYRAWREMVGHLDVSDPETTTPAEFEARAVEAGMDPDDVAELTRLFEEVRYGGEDPDVRESAAVAALRRVEASAAEGGDG